MRRGIVILTIVAMCGLLGLAVGGDLFEVDKLHPGDPAAGQSFGSNLAVKGDVAIIGAVGDRTDGTFAGAAYIFRYVADTWVEEAKLLAPDGAEFEFFGETVDISGDIAIVGALFHVHQGVRSGSAYIYRFNGANWVFEQELLPEDRAAGDEFSRGNIAIDGDVAIVGAVFDDDNGNDSGSAYIFRYDGSGWIEERKLTAFDGSAGDRYGYGLDIEGDVAVAGSFGDAGETGSAYVYRYDGSNWIEETKLTASDRAGGDRFGWSLALSDSVLVVGAWLDDDLGGSSGSAYVFRYDGANWVEEEKLLAFDGASGDNFGDFVEIEGNLIVVGAAHADNNGVDTGSAYIFQYDPGAETWSEGTKLIASDRDLDDIFGTMAGIGTETVLVAARRDADNGRRSGSVYVFSIESPDNTPPVVACTVDVDLLWPPNHDLVNVGLDVSATDDQDPDPVIEVLVFADEDDEEPTGDGTHSPDAKDDGETHRLRSERKGDADGRVYLIVVIATDAAGNMGFDCCTVVVPHNLSRRAIADVEAQAAAAEAFCLENGAAPPGFVEVGAGPVIGPKQ